MKTVYCTDTLILGATFYGCGLAAAMPEALLVESSISIGSDYAFALMQGDEWSQVPATAGANEFRQELISRHALVNDRVLPAALAPVLADWCRKRNIQPRLGWELIGRKGNIYTFVAGGTVRDLLKINYLIYPKPQKAKHSNIKRCKFFCRKL